MLDNNKMSNKNEKRNWHKNICLKENKREKKKYKEKQENHLTNENMQNNNANRLNGYKIFKRE